jgi:two-component system, NtrC family, response regulator AtoC
MEGIFNIFFANNFKMHRIKAVIDEVAKTDITVLIEGESGTGKEVVAQAIHFNSHRQGKPFIKVNCAAIPHSLLESELFGFEKGAFTGAQIKKPGKFELANGGTILLNDISDMDIAIQAKLLQVLQDGEFSRLGGEGDIIVNTRVLATTHDPLTKSMMEGRFREDLYFRINAMNIKVPPLRERKEQVLPLAQYFFDLYKSKYAKPVSPLSAQALNLFAVHEWPGNIRELENMVKRIIIFGEEAAIQDLLHPKPQNEIDSFASEGVFENMEETKESLNLKKVGREAAENAEKQIMMQTLEETRWTRKEAAKLLRISYKAFLYKIQKYRLDKIKSF